MLEKQYCVKYHINDTLVHKQHMMNSCLKMINHLYSVGKYDLALELAKRAVIHDNSKFNNDEIEMFIKIPRREDSIKDCSLLLDDQKKLLKLHWSHNSHHPEHFNDYHEMSEVDIIEMCCDWHARSQQFKNDFLEYVKSVPKDRFGFDDQFFNKIFDYCLVLYRSTTHHLTD